MSTTFRAFKRLVNLSKQEVGRVVLHHYSEHVDRTYAENALTNLLTTVIPGGTPESSGQGWRNRLAPTPSRSPLPEGEG